MLRVEVAMLDSRWNKGWGKLQAYVAREGHATVPDYHMEDGFRLGEWTSELHVMHNFRKTLSEERTRLLDGLEGWYWNWQDVFRSKYHPRAGQHMSPRKAFFSMTASERAAIAYDHLTLLEVMDEAEATWHVAVECDLIKWKAGQAKVVKDEKIHAGVRDAIEHAVALGYLNRPRAGTYRAVIPTPDDWSVEDFSLAIGSALEDGPLSRAALMAATLHWAKENCGLVCEQLTDIGKARATIKDAINYDLSRDHLGFTDRGWIEYLL